MSYVVTSSYCCCYGCRLRRIEVADSDCARRIINDRFTNAEESWARSTAQSALATMIGNDVLLARIPFIGMEVGVQEVCAIEVGTVER
jgi:hypothetical protein